MYSMLSMDFIVFLRFLIQKEYLFFFGSALIVFLGKMCHSRGIGKPDFCFPQILFFETRLQKT